MNDPSWQAMKYADIDNIFHPARKITTKEERYPDGRFKSYTVEAKVI